MATASAFQVGDLIIDLRMRHVTRGEMSLDIADRSFDVLLALVRATPNLMSAQELMDRVWGYQNALDTGTVTVHVRRLRKKIEDDASRPRHLETVFGSGYRFTP